VVSVNKSEEGLRVIIENKLMVSVNKSEENLKVIIVNINELNEYI
jgi:hypothetical protein